MKIINKTKNTLLAEVAILADTFFKRMVGLLGRKEFKPGGALVLKPCNSVHTFFMRFAIDVVFLDRDNKIIGSITHLRPWRFSKIYFLAKSCIEFPAGTIDSTYTAKGDLLSQQI